jgi:hypothetical protein
MTIFVVLKFIEVVLFFLLLVVGLLLLVVVEENICGAGEQDNVMPQVKPTRFRP